MACAPDNMYMEWEAAFFSAPLLEPLDNALDLEISLELEEKKGSTTLGVINTSPNQCANYPPYVSNDNWVDNGINICSSNGSEETLGGHTDKRSNDCSSRTSSICQASAGCVNKCTGTNCKIVPSTFCNRISPCSHRSSNANFECSSSIDCNGDKTALESVPGLLEAASIPLEIEHSTLTAPHGDLCNNERADAAAAKVAPQKKDTVCMLAPPPGTIFAYATEYALVHDAPEACGALSLRPARRKSAWRTHTLVRETVRREFAMEDRYRRRIASSGKTRPRDRKRRDTSDFEWKPESVYKTFVDCKPVFFDKTSYQNHVPRSSCFGKINMRIPKAWTRGPNKLKRPKISPAQHWLGHLALPHFEIPPKQLGFSAELDR